MHRQTYRGRFIKYGLLVGNALVLVAVISFVVIGSRAHNAISSYAPAKSDDKTSIANPLDQLSSADIAVTVARLTDMPEKTAVTNQADTVNAEALVPAAADSSVIAKPQVVSTEFKSKKDIKAYLTVQGDTVTSIAAKFGVTSDSVRWSNDISGDTVSVGATLYIPPISGIVYTVKAGDTPDSLATKYQANKQQLIAYNDAELTNSFIVGERILIADGKQPVPVVVTRAVSSYSYGYAFGSGAIYGSNGYDYGFCTWYVANRIAVPSNWGNANTWDNLAPMSGWTVSRVPRVGAVAQTDRGSEGHVAVIEAVSEDGTQIKYSDMNGIAGWGRTGYSDWVSSSYFGSYIYR